MNSKVCDAWQEYLLARRSSRKGHLCKVCKYPIGRHAHDPARVETALRFHEDDAATQQRSKEIQESIRQIRISQQEILKAQQETIINLERVQKEQDRMLQIITDGKEIKTESEYADFYYRLIEENRLHIPK